MRIRSVFLKYEDKWLLKDIFLLQPASKHKKNLLWSVLEVNKGLSSCRFSSPPRSLFSRIRTLHNAICLFDESVARRVRGGRWGLGRASANRQPATPAHTVLMHDHLLSTQKTHQEPQIYRKHGRKWGVQRRDPAGWPEFTPIHQCMQTHTLAQTHTGTYMVGHFKGIPQHAQHCRKMPVKSAWLSKWAADKLTNGGRLHSGTGS